MPKKSRAQLNRELHASKQMNKYGLTKFEEDFCKNYVYVTDYNARAAVRLVWDEEAEKDVNEHASKLMRKETILRRIKELSDEKNAQLIVDKLYVIEKLKKIVEKNMEEKPSVANKALELIGKTIGIFNEANITISGGAVDDAKQIFENARKKESEEINEALESKLTLLRAEDESDSEVEDEQHAG